MKQEEPKAPLACSDWLALRYRNALADKEWAIACANMELSRGGWTCDWSQDIREASVRMAKIEAQHAAEMTANEVAERRAQQKGNE